MKKSFLFLFTLFFLLGSFQIGKSVNPKEKEIFVSLNVEYNQEKQHWSYIHRSKEVVIKDFFSLEKGKSLLKNDDTKTVYVKKKEGSAFVYGELYLKKHYGAFSLFPIIFTLVICFLLKDPIIALFGGIVASTLILKEYNLGQFFVNSFSDKSTAKIIIIYLFCLGGLLGVWAKTGAAKSLADFIVKHFVKGPKTAKLAAWFLGIIFFQGGTMSAALVGTTVKPITDKEKVSHEELSYIVDSTSSPIASQVPFNAWPLYITTFIFVPGVSFLATGVDRMEFYTKSIPFCFYAILAVVGTLFLSLELPWFHGKGLKKAMKRARETGALDAPNAKPLSSKELAGDSSLPNYKANVFEFIFPLFVLISIAMYTFFIGKLDMVMAFGSSFLSSLIIPLARGVKFSDLFDGILLGMKGLLLGLVILLLAVTIGKLSREIGAGVYLVEIISGKLPYYLLPVILMLITMAISFSTGTSWGTYAISFPLAMPLAWSLAQANGFDLEASSFYMTLCFAAVMDGSVFGDQCSPISDTTVLSSMFSGCDLIDHTKTQIVPASIAALCAGVLWTICAFFFI